MTIACGLCGRTVSPERAGRHSLTCRPQVLARVAEDRKARPAQYQPIQPVTVVAGETPAEAEEAIAAAADALTAPIADMDGQTLADDEDSAPTQGMLFGEEWTR